MDFSNLINQLANGPQAQAQGSNQQPVNYNDWNQMVGSAPPEQFGQAVSGAISQIPPEQYQQHVTPGMGGTDPLGQLPQGEIAGVAQSVLGALSGRGVNLNSVAQGAGVGNLNPNNMSPSDLAGVLSWAQQNHPQALGSVATQYQNQPNILQAILSNPALISTVMSVGSQFLAGRGQNQGPMQQQGGSAQNWS